MQPDGKTLVNFDTIFFTEADPVTVDLTILGQAVRVVATPSSFLWAFDDGTTLRTSTPGDPYPDKTITHRYQRAHVTVYPHVDASYSARFSVRGGAWQDINGTVSIPGPGTPLRIAEATPVLSGNHR